MTDATRRASVRIVNRLGMHARPAAHFVRLASRFAAEIYVSRDALDRVGSWKKATLVELLSAAPKDRRQRGADYYVYFSNDIRKDPTFQQAAQDAGYDTYGLFG